MTAPTLTLSEPGVYGIPVAEYHLDPVFGGSLSSSGARRLLPPSCPAKFRQWVYEGQAPNREFDLGHAAHRLVLGAGPKIVVVDATDWRTKDAKDKRAAAYADGKVPLLADEYDTVSAMAAALRRHPVAGALFREGSGLAEQTLIWFDEEFGVWRRALLDWLSNTPTNGRLIVPDYKTGNSADPDAIAKAMDAYGYDQQLAWYLDGVAALGLAGGAPPAALLVVQEKNPPYLVTICQLDTVALERGHLRNRVALDLYRRCLATDTWPGYADDVVLLGLPPWAERNHETALERGDYLLETR